MEVRYYRVTCDPEEGDAGEKGNKKIGFSLNATGGGEMEGGKVQPFFARRYRPAYDGSLCTQGSVGPCLEKNLRRLLGLAKVKDIIVSTVKYVEGKVGPLISNRQ